MEVRPVLFVRELVVKLLFIDHRFALERERESEREERERERELKLTYTI